jgi:hypothetical protein
VYVVIVVVVVAVYTLMCAIGGRRAIERNIYYWIGSKTPPDKASVACIKAVELR